MQGGENWRGEVRTLAISWMIFGMFFWTFWWFLVMKPVFFKEMEQFWISGLTSDFVILWRSWGTSEICWVFLVPRCQVMPRSEEEESFWSRVISTIACDILSRHPAPVIPHIPPHCRCSKSLEAKHQRTSWESRESKQGVLCWAPGPLGPPLCYHTSRISRVCIRVQKRLSTHGFWTIIVVTNNFCY